MGIAKGAWKRAQEEFRAKSKSRRAGLWSALDSVKSNHLLGVFMHYASPDDVSLLVPVYRPTNAFRECIRSALATSCREIIVSINDAGRFPAVEFAELLSNPRLQVIRQAKQLGLWGNHLDLIRRSTRPWIKFLHGDDRLTDGFLDQMLAWAHDDVAVIGTVVIYENLQTGERRPTFRLATPLKWSSGRYLARVAVTGNELGCPSSTLYRRDALDTSEAAWDNSMHCDYVANVIAASRGSVVLMPPGGVISGQHGNRDSHTQGLDLVARRLQRTALFLRRYPDKRVQLVGDVFGAVEGLGLLRVLAGSFRRGRVDAIGLLGTPLDMIATSARGHIQRRGRSLLAVSDALHWKYNTSRFGRRDGRNLSAVSPVTG